MRGPSAVKGMTADGSNAAKRGYLREMGVPILFGAVVLLVSATLLLGANISALRASLNWMDHSQKVLVELSKLEGAVLSNEMTVRGLALTQDKRFVEFHQREAQRSREALTALHMLMLKEPYRKAQFDGVEKSIEQHLAIFGNLVEPGLNTPKSVAEAILDPDVRENMRLVRTGIAQLRDAESRDLSDRLHDVTNQLLRAFFLAVGIIISAFVFGGFGVWAAQLKGPLKS